MMVVWVAISRMIAVSSSDLKAHPMTPYSSDTVAVFEQLSSLLVDAAPTGPPVVVGVELTAEGVALHTRRICDLDDLIGFDAPATWDGVGITAGGRQVGSTPDAPFDLSVVHLVHRSGAAFGRVARGAETLALDAADTQGRGADLCRRALGLPTAPPSSSVELLWSTMWLDRILGERLSVDLGARPPAWDELCALHPVRPRIDRIAARRPRARRADVWGWDEVRGGVARGSLRIDGVEPLDAAWFDAGSFARHALGRYPALTDLADDLGYLLPTGLADRVRRTVLDHAAA